MKCVLGVFDDKCVWISMFSMSERPLEVGRMYVCVSVHISHNGGLSARCMPPAAVSHLKLMPHMCVFGIIFNYLVWTAIWHSNALNSKLQCAVNGQRRNNFSDADSRRHFRPSDSM